MVLRFRFSNFRSFKDEQDISLIASSLNDAPQATIEVSGSKERALRVCAIYGANASGKTTVLSALDFMARSVLKSHRLWKPDGGVPLETFKGNAGEAGASAFVLDFEVAGVRYQYGFRANPSRVLEEWLWAYPSERKQVWFERKEAGPITFGRSLPGENRTIAGLMRPNSLFLSVAAQNNHEVLTPIYSWFSDSVIYLARNRNVECTSALCSNNEDRLAALSLLAVADLGIVDIQHEVRNPNPDVQEKAGKFVEAAAEFLKLSPEFFGDIQSPRSFVKLIHQVGSEIVPFKLEEESDGTLAYLGLIGSIVGALTNGSILLVDELDASLHPLISTNIVKLFNDAGRNPKSAQLIFNTHDTNLLGAGLLRRDQIWFTEKDRAGASHIYPLTDFKPRRGENLQGGYLQGRYGAIPFMNWESLALVGADG